MKFINNAINGLRNHKQKAIIVSTFILVISIIIISAVLIVTTKDKTEKEVSSDINQEIEEEGKEEISLDDEIVNNEDISELENVILEENSTDTTVNNTTSNKPKSTTTSSNTSTYYIKVNYGAQVTTIYKKDNEGNYTVPIKAMICSTGSATPKSGVYKIPYKYRWLGLQGGVYGQYCTQVVGNILFHSVPYLEKGNPRKFRVLGIR